MREGLDPSIRGGFRDCIRAAREQIDRAAREIRNAYVEMHAIEASLSHRPQAELGCVAPSLEIMLEQARHHSSSSLERYSRCFLAHGDGTLHIATLDPETGQPIVTFDAEKESPA